MNKSCVPPAWLAKLPAFTLVMAFPVRSTAAKDAFAIGGIVVSSAPQDGIRAAGQQSTIAFFPSRTGSTLCPSA